MCTIGVLSKNTYGAVSLDKTPSYDYLFRARLSSIFRSFFRLKKDRKIIVGYPRERYMVDPLYSCSLQSFNVWITYAKNEKKPMVSMLKTTIHMCINGEI